MSCGCPCTQSSLHPQGVWRTTPALFGFYHPQRYWQYQLETQREGLQRADHFHRIQLGKFLAQKYIHLLHPQAMPPTEESARWCAYQVCGLWGVIKPCSEWVAVSLMAPCSQGCLECVPGG